MMFKTRNLAACILVPVIDTLFMRLKAIVLKTIRLAFHETQRFSALFNLTSMNYEETCNTL